MRSKGKKKKLFWLVFAVLGFALFIDAVIIEPRSPVLTTYNVAIPNLPANMDGFRIVQLSDIHRRKTVPDSVIKKAVQIANSTHADAAVLTGDYVGKEPGNIAMSAQMLSGLKTRLGSYAVLGNHDHWTDANAVRKSFKAHGITILNNESARLAKGLYLAGIDDQWTGSPDVKAAFKNVGKTDACIMLSHTPLAVDLFKGHRGLLITGHTHGGQVMIPFVPRNRLPGLRGWKYIKGWYKVGNILMYVNRGIGMINPPVRFLCRPEVTLYILHPAKDGKTKVVNK